MVDAARGDGIDDGLVLCLVRSKVYRYWLGQFGEGGEGVFAILVSGKVGDPGGGIGVLPIPFIKYFQYISSRARCAHNFYNTYQYTFRTIIEMLCNRISCWSELHLRLAVYCCTIPLLTFSKRCSSEVRVTFPMKVSCRLAAWFWIICISKKSLTNNLICDSLPFTCVIVTLSIIMIIWWIKIFSLFRSETLRSHLSHPYSRRFVGMERNTRYFLQRSTDVSLQKWFNAPINEKVEASLLSTSYSSRILYETKLPSYLK